MAYYLAENLRLLRTQKGLNQATVAALVEKGHTTIGNWEKALSEPSLGEIDVLANYFEIPAPDLVYRNLAEGNLISVNETSPEYGNGNLNGNPSGNPTTKNRGKIDLPGTSFTPTVITVDSQGNENILYVPVRAQAGYLLGYSDQEYLGSLQSFRIPGIGGGTFRMFDVSGPSMGPTIGHLDKVIGRYVDDLSDVRDGRVYAVVTKDGFAVKRVLNRISERGRLVMKSDTIAHRSEFRTYEIDYDTIKEIWECKIKLSADFSEPSGFYNRMDNMEEDVREMRELYALMADKIGVEIPSPKLKMKAG